MGLTLRQAGIEDVICVTVESSKLVWAYRGPSRPSGIRSKKSYSSAPEPRRQVECLSGTLPNLNHLFEEGTRMQPNK